MRDQIPAREAGIGTDSRPPSDRQIIEVVRLCRNFDPDWPRPDVELYIEENAPTMTSASATIARLRKAIREQESLSVTELRREREAERRRRL